MTADSVQYRAWRVYRNGKPFCAMTGGLISIEKAQDIAQFHWADATVAPMNAHNPNPDRSKAAE